MFVCTLSGLIVLVPGLTLTTAISELATRHLVSGTSRMMAAGTAFLLIAFGVAVGNQLGHTLLGRPVEAGPVQLPFWTELLAFVVAVGCLIALFRAPLRSTPAILATTTIAYFGGREASLLLGPEIGVFFGAFGAAVAANLYARRFDRPAWVPLVRGSCSWCRGASGSAASRRSSIRTCCRGSSRPSRW